jgi:hypothetical protein
VWKCLASASNFGSYRQTGRNRKIQDAEGISVDG